MAMIITAPWGEELDLEPTAEAIWRVLERGVVWVLGQYGEPPDILAADVAYRREPMRRGRRRDRYQPWPEVVAQKHGDCEDLSMARVAWLRAQGDLSARVGLVEWPRGGWHAVVLRRGRPNLEADDYQASRVARIYGRGTRIYGGPDLGWLTKADEDWFVEDPSRRLGMRDRARGSEFFKGLAKRSMREPWGDARVGEDPYVPFELAGPETRAQAARDLGVICRVLRP